MDLPAMEGDGRLGPCSKTRRTAPTVRRVDGNADYQSTFPAPIGQKDLSMNNARRKMIEGIIGRIETLKDEIDAVLSEEQEAFDNMPEGLQQSARGEAAENAIGSLETATGQLEEAIGELNSAMEAA